MFEGGAEEGGDGEGCGEGHYYDDTEPGEGGTAADDAVVAGE